MVTAGSGTPREQLRPERSRLAGMDAVTALEFATPVTMSPKSTYVRMSRE